MTETPSSPGREAPVELASPANPAAQDGFTDISLEDDSRPPATPSRPSDAADDDSSDSFADTRQSPQNDDGSDQDAAPPPLPARPHPAAVAAATEKPYDARSVRSVANDSRPSTPPPPPPRPARWSGAPGQPMSIDAALASDGASSSSFAASPASGQQRRRHTIRSSYLNLNRPLPQTPSSPTASSTRSSWRDGQPASPSASTYASFSSPLTSILSSPLAWKQSKDSTMSANSAAAYNVPRPLRLQTRHSFLPTPRHSRTSFYSSARAPSAAYAASAGGEGHSFELLDSDHRSVLSAEGDDGTGAYATYHHHHPKAAARDDNYNHVWLRARQSAARMARRRQWSADTNNRAATLRDLLETAEGVFEVQSCFLARLARAENDSLEPESFPRSRAEQDRQRETMTTMRQETVEALQPLLTYGPSRTTSAGARNGGSGSASASASAGGSGSKYGDGGITTLLPPAALLRGSDASSTAVAAAAEVAMPSSAFGSISVSTGAGKSAATAGHRRRRQLPPTPPRSPTGGHQRGATEASETSLPPDGSWMKRASLVLFGPNNGGGGGRGSA